MRKILSIAVFLLISVTGISWNAQAAISAIERSALIDLYNSTDGDNWADNSGWKAPPLHTDGFAMPGTECTWYGVTCSGGSYVIELDLCHNNLVGTIPPSIGYFMYLSYLYLGNNQLSGAIPPELGSLHYLYGLWLNGNLLSGSIPDALLNLYHLETGYSSFLYNALYTLNNSLRVLLNNAQEGAVDWEDTQTTAPKNISAGVPAATSLAEKAGSESSISLTWTGIPYTDDAGGYEVYYSTTSGGPYTLFGVTADKTVQSMLVTGLLPDTTYFFRVRTVTYSHANNQNTVNSEYTNEVSATTTGSSLFTLNVSTSPGEGGSVSGTGISCPNDCTEGYEPGTTVTLTAHPTAGYNFDHWEGDLTGTANPAVITMDAHRGVTAVFLMEGEYFPEPPVAIQPPNGAIIEQGPVTLEALFNDETTIIKSHWLVRRADRTVYNCPDYDASFDHIATTGDLTIHQVTGLEPGMKYIWTVGCEDASGVMIWSQPYAFTMGVSVQDSSVHIHHGAKVGDYRMPSFTQWPRNPSAWAVLGDDLENGHLNGIMTGAYDKTDFKIGTYNPLTKKYIEYGEKEGENDKNGRFYGTYHAKEAIGSCPPEYFKFEIGNDLSRLGEDYYLYIPAAGNSYTTTVTNGHITTYIITISGDTIKYNEREDEGGFIDEFNCIFVFSDDYNRITWTGYETEEDQSDCDYPGTITGNGTREDKLKIIPGRSYWFLARNGLDVTVDGVPVSTVLDIDVKLYFDPIIKDPWNMIACPNNADYFWSDVEVVGYNEDGSIAFGPIAISELPDDNPYIDKRLWRWEEGVYYSDTVRMEKNKGYWVKVKMTNVLLRFPVTAQARLSNPKTMMACILSEGARLLKAYPSGPVQAVADAGDSPPMPMESLSGSSKSGGGGGGCFIATTSLDHQ